MPNLKFALRTLFKTPFVTIVAIVSLALGIGANAAIFSLFDQMLLRPLPVPQPDRLVNLAAPGPKPGSQSCNQAGDCDDGVQLPDVPRPARRPDAVHRHRRASVCSAPISRAAARRWRAEGMLVSGSYFPCSASRRRSAACSTPDDDRAPGEIARRRAQLRLLADALRRRSGRAQPADDRQRPADDDRRRRAAGFRRHDARRRAQGLRADHACAADAPTVHGVRQPAQLLGLSVRAAEAGRLDRAGARRDRRRPTTPSSTTSRRRCRRA